MKNKWALLLCSLILLLFTSVYIFADVIKVISAFASFPKIIESVITHNVITNISSIDKILNAKISVDFGSYISAKAKIIYYINNNLSSSHEQLSADDKNILNKQDFYIKLPIFNNNDTLVSYQIQITLKDSNNKIAYAYFPSSTTFINSNITNSTSTHITTNIGGIVELESGNQEYKNTKLVLPAEALSEGTTIIIKQIQLSQLGTSSEYMSSAKTLKNQMIALYSVTSNPIVEIYTPLSIDFYYGAETEVKKFDLKYRADELSAWKKIKILNTEIENRIISADITEFGQYGIFASDNLNDNDYRPKKRVKIKSRIQNGTYKGFEFNYLQEGDVVKIYNVNGKKIAELKSITNGTAYWNGKKDTDNSGDWAESGTYIYQIKLKEKGKVISGTIAFVW